MHIITPKSENQDLSSGEAKFRIRTEARQSTINTAKGLALVEGATFTDTIRKVFGVYDNLDKNTRDFGDILYGSIDTNFDGSKRLSIPRQFLPNIAMPDDEQKVPLTFNIGQRAKDTIDRHTERDSIDFDGLMTGAFAYYGLLAAHLYAKEDFYVRNLFTKNTTRRIILE